MQIYSFVLVREIFIEIAPYRLREDKVNRHTERREGIVIGKQKY